MWKEGKANKRTILDVRRKGWSVSVRRRMVLKEYDTWMETKDVLVKVQKGRNVFVKEERCRKKDQERKTEIE